MSLWDDCYNQEAYDQAIALWEKTNGKQTMGVNCRSRTGGYSPSSSRFDGGSSYTPSNPNPDPNNYKILKVEEHDQYLIMKIKYPNCTNYEGEKILVFRATLLDVINQRAIDPHFAKNAAVKSPVARFIPTDEGWEMATKFVAAMTE